MSQDFSFMNEKIKDKPFYKRKWVRITSAVVSLAVVFGVVSSLIFVKMCDWMEKKQEQQAIQDIEIPEDTQDDFLTSETDTLNPADSISEPLIVDYELTLDDYEVLYEQLRELAGEVRKSVVTVAAINHDEDWFYQDYQNRRRSSGMIIGDNSVELLVLTQYDTVKQCDEIRVTFADDTDIRGTLKKYDVTTGFAVISVNLSDIPEETGEVIKKAELGNSVRLQAGTPVLAVGRSEGSEDDMKLGTLTSAEYDQSVVDAEYTMLVTDMVNGIGTSGVLVNFKGEVIGIIREQEPSGYQQNVLSAYAISDIKSLIEHLSNNQDVAYLGIKGVDVTEEAQAEGVPAGIYVTEVQIDSPAMRGGIQSGDVIYAVNGQEVSTMKEFSKILQRFSNKQSISLEGQRLTKDGYKKISYETSLTVLE